jgi:hypothetical protein
VNRARKSSRWPGRLLSATTRRRIGGIELSGSKTVDPRLRTLIAIGAALLAATVAVLLDRAWAARPKTITVAA